MFFCLVVFVFCLFVGFLFGFFVIVFVWFFALDHDVKSTCLF